MPGQMRKRALRKLKVMVLGIRGMPNVQGGVETHAEHLYQRLAVRGCDIEALVRSQFVPRGVKYCGAIRLRRLWAPRRRGLEVLVHSTIGVLYAGLVRPDILHIHSIGPAIVTPIARLLGLKVVVTYHSQNYEHEKWDRGARWVLRAGEFVGMRMSHARIAVSRVMKELIRLRHHRDVELIPNGVAPADLRSDSDHVSRLGLTLGRYVLQVGRIAPEKRQLDLIRAYAAASPGGWKLALVGGLDSSSYSQQVQQAAESAGVVLTGYLTGIPLAQLYSNAGGFVLPSSHEGLPIAMLEALSYGLPVIASDIPANREIGLDAHSYFPVGDIAALAQSLGRLTQMADDDASRAARRQWVAENYDWERIAEQTLMVYRSVCRYPP